MDAPRFDTLIRALARGASRRAAVHAATVALGLGAAHAPGVVRAKSRKKKLKRNAFGCVNIGGKCRGKDSVCCSGHCQGKKPKKGKQDKSKCVAHNVDSCPAGADYCLGDGLACTNGLCWQTTGQASFCAAGGNCVPCTRDADCEASEGPGAACVVCSALCEGRDTVCLATANP